MLTRQQTGQENLTTSVEYPPGDTERPHVRSLGKRTLGDGAGLDFRILEDRDDPVIRRHPGKLAQELTRVIANTRDFRENPSGINGNVHRAATCR